MPTVEVAVAAEPGVVALTFTTDDNQVRLVLTPDQARDLSNMVGEGIEAASASRAGALI